MSLKLLRRTALLSLLLPFLYFGAASATFLYRIHADRGARSDLNVPAIAPPTGAQRLVVFAPHCDDETLGCGGLIQRAGRAGAPLRVVFLTNGDGFRVGVERQYRRLHVSPDDYVRFAALRQQETYRALRILGVARQDITFLGYPDRGLQRLWTDNWAAGNPYESPYTERSSSPYPLGYRKDATYCGQGLLSDVEAVLRSAQPTDVYVTHPSDDHPDHSAASAFVSLALLQLRREGADWAARCRVHYYLVHRGDWPVPQGLRPDEPLVPPAEMLGLDTLWGELPLTAQETARKARAILAYRSQTAVAKRFLVSFARRNEVFGEVRPALVARVPDGAAPEGPASPAWTSAEVVVRDPVNDSLLRDFQAGGDIRSVSACRDASTLYLRVDTHQPVSPRVSFSLRVRYFGDPARGQAGGACRITVSPSGAASPADFAASVRGRSLEVALPLRELAYAPTVAVDVETRFAGFQIDHTGFRFLRM